MIGVLGGGQLGRMLALAAARLGLEMTVLEPGADCPAGPVCARTITAPYDDPAALEELARTCAVVTFEFENVPAAVVERLEAFGAHAAPGRLALATAQDRLTEKTFLRSCGLAVADFAAIDRADDIRAALARLGPRALLKTRREGYDGKGQTWVEGPADAEAACASCRSSPRAVAMARRPAIPWARTIMRAACCAPPWRRRACRPPRRRRPKPSPARC
jgi:5-(carboxyamino)imidazole ribonucleotide synthase